MARRARSSRPRWAPPPLAGLAEGVWASLTELAALWEAEAVFEPQLPRELADATHAVWRRAVEKSMGWADLDAGS